MLHSLTLKNFRCFQDLTIEPLERINLIGGKNNVGKTSLLEAIFIFINPGNPKSLLQINQFRGISVNRKLNSNEVYNIEELRSCLQNQDTQKTIELSCLEDSNLQRRILKIRLAESDEAKILRRSLFDDEIELVLAEQSHTTEVRPYDTLVFEYQDETKKTTSHIALTVHGSLVGEYRLDNFPVGIYLTTKKLSTREDVVRYSKLELAKQQDEVLETLNLLEPRLQRLTVLVGNSEPIIYGDIGMRELVPLPLMGEGIGRLLSIILAIANAKGGIILIDEIENGLHHSVLTNVWKAIANAARRADVQVFATTHSRECILAAHQAFKNSDKYDFRYHRLDRTNDDIQAFTYDQDALETSDEFNWEIR
ncbi:AAA family ATPase [Cronbergia sp. UHCC 0137]|uniref:AAA family ATPase n=1 Tax=Cronbergia sp. UHCC 0137 TaxID=3110239 RepID=UPI002B20F7F6|nr:AAA family ATPase [Cronbergia sp. UHCC 0137]MEA5620342.1 AAA family ATPase [Cronbergia sp. UHCC 0137]